MKTIKGPAIFLAQFAATRPPSTRSTRSANGRPRWATRACRSPPGTGACFDLKKASDSKDYADEVKGVAASHGLEITELSTHLQGQLVAVHPAYDAAFGRLRRAGSARQSGRAHAMGE